MGAQYYLDPFDREMPAGQSGRAKYAQKDNCYVIKQPATEVRQIPSNATLIIDGHSSFGSETISRVGVGADNQTIHYTLMAGHLFRAGLPRTHVLIRLLACEGFLYASRLAAALGGYGYNQIAVGGYTATNYQIPGQRTRYPPSYYDRSDRLNQAKPIFWYGSAGQRLDAKPGNVLTRVTDWRAPG